MINFPDNINRQLFLSTYWQRQPLLCRSALDNSEQLISNQKLYELAQSDIVESRLILEDGPDEKWQIIHGPQYSEQINSLSEKSNWTLLVQSVNLWHQGCAELLNAFEFIPQWRLDDIMISYAAASGSVGPHIDQYDVFLIQLSGTRRWLVGKADTDVELIDKNSPSRHIKPFPAIIDKTLNPGDMLYVPPNTAHHGICIEPGMTLSVGFRSPALSEMMMLYAEQLMLSDKESFLADPELCEQSSTTEISPASMSNAVNWFTSSEVNNALIRKTFGMLQTQPKQELLLVAVDQPIKEIINFGIELVRDPAARVAWHQVSETMIWLFINGECIERPIDEKIWIELLSTVNKLSYERLSDYLSDDKFIILLQIFVENGLFGIE